MCAEPRRDQYSCMESGTARGMPGGSRANLARVAGKLRSALHWDRDWTNQAKRQRGLRRHADIFFAGVRSTHRSGASADCAADHGADAATCDAADDRAETSTAPDQHAIALVVVLASAPFIVGREVERFAVHFNRIERQIQFGDALQPARRHGLDDMARHWRVFWQHSLAINYDGRSESRPEAVARATGRRRNCLVEDDRQIGSLGDGDWFCRVKNPAEQAGLVCRGIWLLVSLRILSAANQKQREEK